MYSVETVSSIYEYGYPIPCAGDNYQICRSRDEVCEFRSRSAKCPNVWPSNESCGEHVKEEVRPISRTIFREARKDRRSRRGDKIASSMA